jgi:mRNA interferase MazF
VGGFVKGDIVVVPFPFSDLAGNKRRPALVLADLDGDDIILCQITSRSRTDVYAVPLATSDFTSGALPVASIVRPNKLFTADKSLILYVVAKLSMGKLQEVTQKLVEILTGK